MYKQTLPLFLCILLSACDLIDYHPYDGRLTISERDINGHNIPLIEAATKDKDTIRFVLIGDTQRSYDETEDFVKHINTKKDSIDFIIHGGDYTEFGMYNPQNEMFRLLRTKSSFSQNEKFFFSHPYPALFRLISHLIIQ